MTRRSQIAMWIKCTSLLTLCNKGQAWKVLEEKCIQNMSDMCKSNTNTREFSVCSKHFKAILWVKATQQKICPQSRLWFLNKCFPFMFLIIYQWMLIYRYSHFLNKVGALSSICHYFLKSENQSICKMLQYCGDRGIWKRTGTVSYHFREVHMYERKRNFYNEAHGHRLEKMKMSGFSVIAGTTAPNKQIFT